MCAGRRRSNADVGDKANDAIRISALEVGAKVVGEGANLGMTPKARIAYGLKGGRCNSDAIDNSAGVNTSDVEVNIKIALAPAVRSGKLSADRRLKLLKSMTDDVAALVLRNNYQQTLAISLEARRGVENLGNQMRLMAELEERGLLDREVEDLPTDAALETRAASGHGLTRAEIGTLLAFAKIALFNDPRRQRRPRRSLSRARALPLFPRCRCASATPRRSTATACGARSSPRSLRTPSSIAAARRCWSRRATAPAPRWRS